MIRRIVTPAVLMLALAAGSARPLEAQAVVGATAAQVNLNTATATELERLPGVGPAMVTRILEYRQKNGGFKKIEDILENARSCPCLLRKHDSEAAHAVAGSRRNAQ